MYLKEAFDVYSLQQAKNVVLSEDPNFPNKFTVETDFLVSKILKNLEIGENTKILDFGCGMGRVSKSLIEKTNCYVIGVDISKTMLNFAVQYVNNEKFSPNSTYYLKNSVDIVLCIFSLQHVENPSKEIENLINILKPKGHLVLLNDKKRYIPSGTDRNNFVIWQDDNFDVGKSLNEKLTKIKDITYLNKPNQNILIFQKLNN